MSTSYSCQALHALSIELESSQTIPIETLAISPGLSLLKRSVQKMHALHNKECDRIKDIYEGGLKTWECSVDLVQYLQKTTMPHSPIHRVLELGCGSGLPGIYCQMRFAYASVDFQDFNASVLALVTLPNLALNMMGASEATRATFQHSDVSLWLAKGSTCMRSRFYAGDWAKLMHLPLEEGLGNYDLILSSETLYDASNYPKLLGLLTRWLKRPSGIAVFATKAYYFGLDGGSVIFEQFLLTVNAPFDCHITPFHTQGVRRDIVLLKWK